MLGMWLAGTALAATDVALVTDFPVLVGASAAYEHTSRARAELTAGWMPGPYVDAINGGLTAFDVYSDETAALIEAMLQNAVGVHAQVGYRPIADRGLTTALGYQFIGLTGDTTDLSLYSEADLPEGTGEEVSTLDASVSPHMLTAEVGYQWHIQERWVLRTSLAFAYTVHANATVTTSAANTRPGQLVLDAATAGAETYLIDVFESWVHLPMIGVSAGYRFP